MFLDEARLASQLQHPNIPQVFDVGRFGDTYFFTMEYVHGETLRTVLQHAYEDNRDIPIVSDATSIISRSCGSSSSPSPGRRPEPEPEPEFLPEILRRRSRLVGHETDVSEDPGSGSGSKDQIISPAYP